MSGNLWKISDELGEEDIRFAMHEFITYKMGQEYYGIGEKPFTRFAKEAGAVYKIGTKMVRINRLILEAYLREKQAKRMNNLQKKNEEANNE